MPSPSACSRAPLPPGLRQPVPARFGLVGASPAAVALHEAVEAAARATGPVLVTGEAGAGKKAVARAIHAASGAGGALRLVACAQVGRHALADLPPAGTVVLEGLAELGPEAQARLLHALDEGVPARIVATLETGDGAREPRADLLARIGRRRVHVAPLRERATDVPLLVEHFLTAFCSRRSGCIGGVTPEALSALARDGWPGNVRELREVVEKAVLTGRSGWIDVADLPARLGGGGAPAGPPEEGALPTLAQMEEQLIRLALSRHDGNKARVARALGISRHRLYDRLRKMGLE